MKKLLSKINKVNKWWDSIKEPNRFFYFLLFIGLPVSILFAYAPLVGFPVALLLVLFRMSGAWMKIKE